MYRDGYLVRYTSTTVTSSSQGQLVFVVLNEGNLRFYDHKGGNLLDEFRLTGKMLKVEALKPQPSKCPHRFSVRAVDVINVNRRLRVGETSTFELCAPSASLLKEWANSIHLWKRMNWKDDVSFSKDGNALIGHEQEKGLLLMYLKAVKGPLNPHSLKKKCSFMHRIVASAAANPMSPVALKMLIMGSA